MRDVWKHQILIALVSGLIAFTCLGTPRLWDDDESKNSTCAAEMLARGDWIVPTFNAHLRTDKPILLYWFMIPAYRLLGVNEFSARLTSALFGIGTVLLTYHLGRRLFSPAAGLWAAMLLATSLMFGVATRAATPDSLLIFFSTLAVWFFAKDSVVAGATACAGIVGLPRKRSTYLLMYGAMSLAVLAKGPVGLVLPTAVCGLYLLVLNPVTIRELSAGNSRGSRIRDSALNTANWFWQTFHPKRVLQYAWALRPLTAIGVCAVIALPWYVAVGIKTGGAWPYGFFWQHNVNRFVSPMEGHRGPPVYHLFSIAAGFFPASVFLTPMVLNLVRRIKDRDPARPGYLLAVCWISVYFAVFSLAGTKLPNYVTPCYPALALLTGALLARWIASPASVSRFWKTTALVVFGLAGLGLLLGVAMAAPRVLPGQGVLGLIGLIPILGAVACLAAMALGRMRLATATFVACAALFTTTLFAWGAVRVDKFQTAAPLLALTNQSSPNPPRLASYRILRASWVFYAGHPIPLLDQPSDVAAYFAQPGPALLIVEDKRLDQLTGEWCEVGRVAKFLERGNFVVLGRPSDSQPPAQPSVANQHDRQRR